MKTFFLFIDGEQQGPFNLEELKTKKIDRDTKVWFEGLEDWNNAEEIEELKSIFVSIPPWICKYKVQFKLSDIFVNVVLIIKFFDCFVIQRTVSSFFVVPDFYVFKDF